MTALRYPRLALSPPGPNCEKAGVFTFLLGGKLLLCSVREEKARGPLEYTRCPEVTFSQNGPQSWHAAALACPSSEHALVLSRFQALCCTYTDHPSVKRAIVVSTDWGPNLPLKVIQARLIVGS